MNDISPNPELMEQYGTDELYLRNLEKRAAWNPKSVEDVMDIETEGQKLGWAKVADTIFGQPTADLSESEWGRLVTGKDQEQAGLDRQRMDAASLNLKFRHLEAGRMADTIEHAGGPGTRRARFTRAMMYQPYALHPMMMMGGMGGGGAMSSSGYITPPGTGSVGQSAESGGEMAVEASAQQSWAKLAVGNPYWGQQPGGMSPPPPQPLPVDAHVQAAQRQLGETARHLGHSAGQATLATGHGFGQLSQDVGHGFGQLAQRTGTAAQRAVQAARSGKRGPQKPSWLTRMGRGIGSFMAQDIQATPRWGTGMPPAANVNQYGVPIW